MIKFARQMFVLWIGLHLPKNEIGYPKLYKKAYGRHFVSRILRSNSLNLISVSTNGLLLSVILYATFIMNIIDTPLAFWYNLRIT